MLPCRAKAERIRQVKSIVDSIYFYVLVLLVCESCNRCVALYVVTNTCCGAKDQYILFRHSYRVLGTKVQFPGPYFCTLNGVQAVKIGRCGSVIGLQDSVCVVTPDKAGVGTDRQFLENLIS